MPLPKCKGKVFFFKKKQFLLAFLRERIKLTISSKGGIEQACPVAGPGLTVSAPQFGIGKNLKRSTLFIPSPKKRSQQHVD
jgi:hypothetical protein